MKFQINRQNVKTVQFLISILVFVLVGITTSVLWHRPMKQ